jgi:hypothetical protein
MTTFLRLRNFIAITFIATVFVILGCNKSAEEQLFDTKNYNASASSMERSSSPEVTTLEAQEAFKEFISTEAPIASGPYAALMKKIRPLWAFAHKPIEGFNGQKTITYVPIYPMRELSFKANTQTKLMFTRDNNGQVQFSLLVVSAEKQYYLSKSGKLDSDDFTGYTYSIKTNGTLSQIFEYSGGKLMNVANIGAPSTNGVVVIPNPDTLGNPTTTALVHCHFCPETNFSENSGNGNGQPPFGYVPPFESYTFVICNETGVQDAVQNSTINIAGIGIAYAIGTLAVPSNCTLFTGNVGTGNGSGYSSPILGSVVNGFPTLPGANSANGSPYPTFSNTYSDPAVIREEITIMLNALTDPSSNYLEEETIPSCQTGLNQTAINTALTDQVLSWLGSVPGAVSSAFAYITSCPLGSGNAAFRQAVQHMKSVLEYAVIHGLTLQEF